MTETVHCTQKNTAKHSLFAKNKARSEGGPHCGAARLPQGSP